MRNSCLSNILRKGDVTGYLSVLRDYSAEASGRAARKGKAWKQTSWREVKRKMRRATIATALALARRHERRLHSWTARLCRSANRKESNGVRAAEAQNFVEVSRCCVEGGLRKFHQSLGSTEEERLGQFEGLGEGEIWPAPWASSLEDTFSLVELVTNDVENEHAFDQKCTTEEGGGTDQASFSARSFTSRAKNLRDAQVKLDLPKSVQVVERQAPQQRKRRRGLSGQFAKTGKHLLNEEVTRRRSIKAPDAWKETHERWASMSDELRATYTARAPG